MLNNIKLGQKLIGGFLIVALFLLFVGLISLMGLNSSGRTIRNNMEKSSNITASVDLARSAQVSFKKQVQAWKDLLIRGGNVENFNTYLKEFNDEEKNTQTNLNDLIGLMNKAGIPVDAVNQSLITHKDLGVKYLEALKAYDKNNSNSTQIVDAMVKGIDRAPTDAIDSIVKQINDYSITEAKNIQKESDAESRFNFLLTVICLIIGVIAAVFLGIILTRSVTKSVGGEPAEIAAIADRVSKGDLDIAFDANARKLTGIFSSIKGMVESLSYKAGILEKIANGDLTEKVKVASEKDMLGKSLVKMTESLNNSMSQINSAVEQTASGSNQVASASQALSQGATEQASSLEEITSSITEINSQAKQNAENALQASSLAKKALENSNAGNKQMKELVTSMVNITKSAEMIKKIVKVIDDIAFQTNLLALNANVEAARAGKYGKGFAVVAEEVRNLAGRSAQSVKETTSMVEEAVKNILNGNNLVEVTAKQLDEIANSANKVADLVEEIATASKEQTQGLEQINQGLGQIDQVTQNNTANAEESASAAEELASQAQQLKGIVAQFKLSEEFVSKQVEDNTEKNNTHNIHKLQNKLNVINPKHVIKLDDTDFGKF